MLSVIDVKVTEIQTRAERRPQFFINLFLQEGVQSFADYLSVGVFIPISATYADDTSVRMDMTGFF